jgi:hypothetical protein
MLRLRVPAGGSAPAEWVAGAGGLLPGLPASVPLGLPRIPGSFHPRRRGAGHLLGAAERAEVQVRLGPAPPALSTTAGQHGRDGEFPDPAGLGSGSGRLGGGVVVDGADERLGGGGERLDAAGGAAEDQRALER